jgi:lysophospholipase
MYFTGYTFSSIAGDTEFSTGAAPMPIVVAIERPPGQLMMWENSTVIEFNPWEMGSYDSSNPAFAPLRYIGSNFTNGHLPSNVTCVAGFDNAGFVVGTSSSLFNQAFLQIQDYSDAPNFLLQAINNTLARIGEKNNDVSLWPNPFYQYNIGSNQNSNYTTLTLVDGGEDLQNLPLNPLTSSLRQVDVILAVDSSADTPTAWPNGTSLVATYQRSDDGFAPSNREFPPVPDQNSFVNLGLNRWPTFFGCEAKNTTDAGPLIVYLPNTPYSFFSNVSTFDLEYTTEERDKIIQNGYDVVTMGNASVDPQWPACLGCAILSRSFDRTKTAPPPMCVDCFKRYCWNGTVNLTTPVIFEPAQIIVPESAGERVVIPFFLSSFMISWLVILTLFTL